MSKRAREGEEPPTPEREKRQYVRHFTPERAEIRGAELLRQKLISDGLITRTKFSRSDLFALFGVSDRTGYQILKRPSARLFGHSEGDVETRGRPPKNRDEEERQPAKSSTQGAENGKGKKRTPKGGKGALPLSSSRANTIEKKKTVDKSRLPPGVENLSSFLGQPDRELVSNQPPVGEGTFSTISPIPNGVENDRSGGSSH